ncbi:unnamed protein product [Adineta steineri]|uniref:Guanylate kinase/L-type calcium channel beta subunit domain-containing protein n=1 Tax=Adineta steineri TaxID=433720 RepID=A0A813QXA1_9BILA|nr:unnamed protein product [Adineta steineri]CAF1408538.1 unnamed protein product [Adineta steineri]
MFLLIQIKKYEIRYICRIFERDISNDLFVEHREYETNLYGTSKSAIEIRSDQLNKICILNLLLYIIYMKIPSTIEKLREYFYVNEQQWIKIEQNYSYLFDKIICLNDSFDSIVLQFKFLIKHVQIKPMWVFS